MFTIIRLALAVTVISASLLFAESSAGTTAQKINNEKKIAQTTTTEKETTTTSTTSTTTTMLKAQAVVTTTTRPYVAPALPADLEANRQLGKQMMLVYFGEEEWPCLDQLWSSESGWSQYADNPSSDAYGIPQSLPGSKMASKGADWATNPATQIAWGIEYIIVRYGTPCEAWNEKKWKGWY